MRSIINTNLHARKRLISFIDIISLTSTPTSDKKKYRLASLGSASIIHDYKRSLPSLAKKSKLPQNKKSQALSVSEPSVPSKISNSNDCGEEENTICESPSPACNSAFDVSIELTEKPSCMQCGVHFSIDHDVEPLTKIDCPDCKSRQIVTARIKHFVCHQQLGRGGMGITYRAFDENLQREVAIKLFSNNLTRSQTNIDDMIKEARKAAALSHPHIVPIYSIGSANGSPYIVMELLSDTLINDLVAKRIALKERFALKVGLSISKALAEAEKNNLLHLDVKPANILTDHSGNVKLIDFGLACQNDDPLKGWGTCHYMPPERLIRKGQDWRSDQYSLGVTLWTMLAGRPLFEEADIKKLSKLIVSQAPPLLSDINPDLHQWTVGLIHKMMSYRAEDRYQSYKDLIKSFKVTLAELKKKNSSHT